MGLIFELQAFELVIKIISLLGPKLHIEAQKKRQVKKRGHWAYCHYTVTYVRVAQEREQ